MNNMEELLWKYIDGNCTADEQRTVRGLIASNGPDTWRIKYQELLNLNKAFDEIGLDEPPVAFTYNVIEAIRAEQAQKPLKAGINKKIIMGIALFFIITISGLIVFTLANIHLQAFDISFNVPPGLTLPDLKNHFTKPVMEGLMFFDVLLALLLFDTFLRRKFFYKQV